MRDTAGVTYHPTNHPPVRPRSAGKTIAIIVGVAMAGLCAVCAVLAGIGWYAGPVTPGGAPPGTVAARQTPDRTVPAPTPSLSVQPVLATVPNLVGVNAAVAGDELTRLGFTNVDYGSQDPDDKVVLRRANWTVTKQSTPAGTQVRTDTLIVLTCTKT